MKKLAISAALAGGMLVAVPAQASAAGWEPSSGTTVVDAVNPCTGETIDLTFSWVESRTLLTGSQAVKSSITGTYVGTDGSSGTVRVASGSALTRTGYTDSYRQQAIGQFEGRSQRITFVFRIVVDEDIDVKIQRTSGTCARA